MEQIKCSLISKIYAADNRRMTFDIMNSEVLQSNAKVDTVFIGDSITEFWDLNVYFNKGLNINRGISGDVVEGVAHRFDADVIQLKPKACVMLIGINYLKIMDDFATNELSLKGNYDEVFNFIDNKLIVDAMAYYEEIMNKCKNNNIKLFTLSVLPCTHDLNVGKDYRNYYVDKLNIKIEELTKKYNATFVECNSKMKNDLGMSKKELFLDGVHPIGKGYQIMVDSIKPLLDEYIAK